MTHPLDEPYFEWLNGQVCGSRKASHKRYSTLLHILHEKEFTWFVANDDNRAEDGKDLRVEFVNESELSADHDWLHQYCSFLEMLTALSRNVAFLTDVATEEWFWHFLEILELADFNDSSEIPIDLVEDILNTVVWRTYEPNGSGGLFPLRYAHQDQRKVELWYQMNAYLIENDDY